MSAWKPIESAPRDGRVVLLFDARSKIPLSVNIRCRDVQAKAIKCRNPKNEQTPKVGVCGPRTASGELTMAATERDGLDVFLFSEGAELVDLKCFRGHRDDVSEDDVRSQIHAAFMQRKMKRAVAQSNPPAPEVAPVIVSEFVAEISHG